MAVTRQQVAELYVATFNRAPDAAGLDYWVNTSGLTIEEIAQSFFDQTETQTLYPEGTTDTAFVTSIYTNLFNRAPDADGLAYWVAKLTATETVPAEMTRDVMIEAMKNGATGTDATIIANKATVGLYYADTLGLDGTDFSLASVTEVASTVDTAKAEADVDAGALRSTLTTETDTVVGTAFNDVITATSTTMATADVILDQSTTDNDTLNLTLTTAMATGTHDAKVSGIENINVIWNAFGTATVKAANFSGATITGTSSKVGFLGHMTVDGTAANNVVAGAGMVGTLTVNDVTASEVDAGYAKTVVVNSAASADADDTLALTAGTSTTSVTAAGFKTMTVDAGTATTIALTDTDAAALTALDTATLTFGANATLANEVDVLTVQASVADKTLTLTNTAATVKSIDVAGTNAMTIKVADASAAGYTGLTITNTGTGAFTYKTGALVTGALDISKIAADSFVFTAGLGQTVTTKTGAVLTLEADGGASTAFTHATGSADTLTLNISTDQTILTATATETLTVNVAAEDVDGLDATIAALNVGTNKAILAGTNDIKVTLLTAKTFDATALVGDLTVASTANAATTISGATGENDITFTGTTGDRSFTGQNDDDTVSFANTAANATAILGNGANSVIASSMTTGSLVVIGGTGVDTVTASTAGTGTGEVNLDLGAGNDVMAITTGGTNDVVTISAGTGNDKLTLAGASTANDVFTLAFGDGTDTLVTAVDLTAGTWSVSGLEVIDVTSNAATAKIAASVLNGATFEIKASGTNGDMGQGVTGFTDELITEIDTAGSYDFSGLVLNNSLADGVSGLNVLGSAGNDTIVGTSGNDIIDGNDGTDTITGGLGMDSMTAGTGVDTFIIGTADNTATAFDTISGFATAADFIKTGTAGSATNYAEIDGNFADGASVAADVATAKTDAETLMDGTVKYVFVYNTNVGNTTTNGYLFADNDLDGTADQAIVLVGLDAAADFASTNIIA